jgi:hypothetical protein
MTDLQRVSLRLFQELSALVLEVGDYPLPQRGKALTPEMDALGEKAARHWLKTGRRPILPDELAAWYPRLWFANSFLRNAVLHEKRHPASLGRPAAIPSVLMLEVWEKSGRAYWESPETEMPWGG